jgi:hypothetical protein
MVQHPRFRPTFYTFTLLSTGGAIPSSVLAPETSAESKSYNMLVETLPLQSLQQ